MTDVFLSYAQGDRARAASLAAALEARGLSVWWDRRLQSGAEFAADIERELSAAGAAVVVWSAEAAASRWVRDEAGVAADAGKLLAVSLDGSPPPLGFRQYHTLDLAAWRGDPDAEVIGDLVAAVHAKLSREDGAGRNSADGAADRNAANQRHRRHRYAYMATGVLLLAVLGLGAWWLVDRSTPTDLPISSLAVLPLTGIGLPADSEWLTHGIASELTNMLSSIPELRVASQAHAFAFAGSPVAEAARELAVDALLLGSLHAIPEGLELRAELVRTDDSEVVWRESFRGTLEDPLSLERRLAGQIFKFFGESMTEYGRTRPKTPEAYAAHLRRLSHTHTGNTAAELEWAEMTVALEPDFAMGYVYLVFPYLYAAINDPYGPWPAKIRSALDRAAGIGIEDSAQYKAHEGLYQWFYGENLDGAERLLREAFVAGDTYAKSYYPRLLSSSGLHEPLRDLFERLTVTESYLPLHWSLLGIQRAHLGDFAGAIAAWDRELSLTGDNFMTIETRTFGSLAAGDVDAARRGLEKLRALSAPAWRLAGLEAYIELREGSDAGAIAAAEALAAAGNHFSAAALYLELGDPRAESEFAAVLASPVWWKHWLGHEWMMSADARESATWRRFKAALGYTDEWRLELCRRIATLPPDTGLACDPRNYESDAGSL